MSWCLPDCSKACSAGTPIPPVPINTTRIAP
jgi:hypothetical protein